MKNILILLVVLWQSFTQDYYVQPVWVTSNYFRANNKDVIGTLTGSSVKPTYTFIFSSPLTGIPNLGYGIKNYQGNDYFGQQRFQIQRIDLTASTFEVSVQIVGVTNIWILNVPYIAIDPQFPHHLNSFDNVPVNYGQTLTNITSQSSQLLTYTNYVNYTEQAASLRFNTFDEPLQNNKILLFMTSLFIWGQLEYGIPPLSPIDFYVQSAAISQNIYYMSVNLSVNVKIQKLHFSQIIFNQDDVESLKAYSIVAQTIDVPQEGMFIEIPQQFIDNFIIGITDFSTTQGSSAFYFNWEYLNFTRNYTSIINSTECAHLWNNSTNSTTNITNDTDSINCTQILELQVFGIEVLESIPKEHLFQSAFDRQGITLFYIKTWICPASYYFDLSNNLCTICFVEHCIVCSNSTTCYKCDEENNYFVNVTTGLCEQCYLDECNNCSTLYTCRICNDNITYGVIGSQVLSGHNNSLLQLCDYCNSSLNQFINYTSYYCEYCAVPSCIICTSLVTCILCNQTNQYFLNTTDEFCYLCGDIILGCVDCESLYKCLKCNESADWGPSMISPDICAGCNESCICGGYTFPWNSTAQQCSPILGDGIIVLDQECDDGNLKSGDGCSSNSIVQSHYYCVLQPSQCYVDLNLTFTHLSLLRSGCNSFRLWFQVFPVRPQFAEIPILQAITVQHQNISQVTGNYYESNGSITLLVSYDGDITNPIIQVRQPFTSTIIINYNSIIPTVHYSQQQCQGYQTVKSILQGIQIASYVILFSSLVSFKIIGLQLFGVLQLAFFTLADHQIVNLYLSPFLAFKTFNGINIQAMSQTASLPIIIQELDLFSLFMNNYNIMYLLLVIEVFVGLVLYGIGKIKSISIVQKIGKYLLKQVLITFIMFSAFNVAVSAGLHWKYAKSTDSSYVVSSLCLYTALILTVVGMGALQLTKSKQYGEFKDKFKQNKIAKLYITISIVCRMAIGLYIPLEDDFEEGSLIFMSLFLLYFFMVRPFTQKLHNIRGGVMHGSSFIILVVSAYYNTDTSNVNTVHSHVPAQILLGTLIGCVVISLGVLVFETVKFIKKVCKKWKKNKVENEAKLQNQKKKETLSDKIRTKQVTQEELLHQTTINKIQITDID